MVYHTHWLCSPGLHSGCAAPPALKPGLEHVAMPPLALQPGVTCSGLSPLALEPALHGVWTPLPYWP